MGLFQRLKEKERAFRYSFNVAPDTPALRRRAEFYTSYFDHGILRKLWSNFHKVAPGVYRSNHPDRRHLEKMKALGIRTVINLRGTNGGAPYLIEQQDCAALGLRMIDVNMVARMAPPRDFFLQLFDAFRAAEKPFVMHCKSGADRSGLAAALWLITYEGETVAQARRMLSPRYIHFKWTKTGVLDHILDCYEARLARGQISFEDWIRSEYDHQDMQRSYLTRKAAA